MRFNSEVTLFVAIGERPAPVVPAPAAPVPCHDFTCMTKGDAKALDGAWDRPSANDFLRAAAREHSPAAMEYVKAILDAVPLPFDDTSEALARLQKKAQEHEFAQQYLQNFSNYASMTEAEHRRAAREMQLAREAARGISEPKTLRERMVKKGSPYDDLLHRALPHRGL